MALSQGKIAEVLRDRILRGIRAGSIAPGDRLPSARELVAEFKVDNRVILAAYRELSDDGLVQIRERGGVYVERPTAGENDSPLPVKWFADTFAEALARGIPSGDLAECLRRLVDTVRLRVVVITSTEDQVAGLSRELREDFGLVADGFTGATLAESDLHHAVVRRADLIVTTAAPAPLATTLGEKFGKPVVTIDVRSDMLVGEWSLLLRQPVWAVVATAEFGELLKSFFAGVRGIENLKILVHGRDDLSSIPLGAPTYVTHRVREAIAGAPIKGRLLPPARTISTESARQIFDFIVRANRVAQTAVRISGESANQRA